jgi:hypothetical protein
MYVLHRHYDAIFYNHKMFVCEGRNFIPTSVILTVPMLVLSDMNLKSVKCV